MPDKISWLLSDPHGQETAERIRRAGHQAIRTQFNGTAIAAAALSIAQQAFAQTSSELTGGRA